MLHGFHVKHLLLKLRGIFFFFSVAGWHVEKGDIHMSGLKPVAVISLTAPKMCMEGYNGVHYIGGRYMNIFNHTIHTTRIQRT